MIRLLLLSKHITNPVHKQISTIIGKKNSQIKILFSSNAADRLKIKNESLPFIDLAQQEIKRYNVEPFDLNTYIGQKNELLKKLKNSDAVFFTGGAYLVLLDAFYKTGLIRNYTKILKKGLLHIGFSAGALIASFNMKYYEGIDDTEAVPKYQKGLGIFPHYIIPHYSDKPKYTKLYEKLFKKNEKKGIHYIPLTNSQAIYVEGKKWQIL